MPRFVAFLRAINVGGRRVTNVDLCGALDGGEFDGVQAYQAAGNLILDCSIDEPAVVTTQVEEALQRALGYSVPTFLRTAEETRRLAQMQPFSQTDVDGATAKPQVVLLLSALNGQAVENALALSSDADRLVVEGREIHWLPVAGVGRSSLDLNALARIVGPTTVRTAGTIQRIANRFLV